MFQPKWPSSGVQVVVVQDFAAHCNAVCFPSIVIASGYFFWLCGLHMVAFAFVWFAGCGCLECSCWGGSVLCYDG
jgi:hypothetical protein